MSRGKFAFNECKIDNGYLHVSFSADPYEDYQKEKWEENLKGMEPFLKDQKEA
jgi:hypothetical protein